jgi:catechol 2,3-dioxygenase-like lactoylglutathione lyase family enzyme
MVEVLSSRILLRPTDLDRSRAFYRDTLGLSIFREFGPWERRGTVFFLGGGFLELSGGSDEPPQPGATQLWLQAPDPTAARDDRARRGVPIVQEPRREPWGLIEMRISDPDGLPVYLVEVPGDHPMRYRG